jgi:glycosyl transferase family 2
VTTPTPAVSVLIPTYERREYVCRAVRSVFAQRYQDWELIVVDDGSTDGTGEALQAFGPRLRYLWQENRGVAAARNAGLRLARGEIVAFLDSDDRWLPHHLETVVAMLERFPEAVLASTCPRFHTRERERVAQTRLVDALPTILVSNQVGYLPSIAIRRGALVAIGGFDERLVVGEDSDALVRLAFRGPFSVLSRRTMLRQHTRGSLSERGGRSGAFLEAWRLMSAGAARATVEAGSELAVRAAGGVHYAHALAALVRGDREAARAGLVEACRSWPELSRSPELVFKRIGLVVWERPERLRVLAAAALLWPEPSSDTALFLRGQAMLLALRLGRPREALALLRGVPARAAPGFLARRRSLIALLFFEKVQRYIRRGHDAPNAFTDGEIRS